MDLLHLLLLQPRSLLLLLPNESLVLLELLLVKLLELLLLLKVKLMLELFELLLLRHASLLELAVLLLLLLQCLLPMQRLKRKRRPSRRFFCHLPCLSCSLLLFYLYQSLHCPLCPPLLCCLLLCARLLIDSSDECFGCVHKLHVPMGRVSERRVRTYNRCEFGARGCMNGHCGSGCWGVGGKHEG